MPDASPNALNELHHVWWCKHQLWSGIGHLRTTAFVGPEWAFKFPTSKPCSRRRLLDCTQPDYDDGLKDLVVAAQTGQHDVRMEDWRTTGTIISPQSGEM